MSAVTPRASICPLSFGVSQDSCLCRYRGAVGIQKVFWLTAWNLNWNYPEHQPESGCSDVVAVTELFRQDKESTWVVQPPDICTTLLSSCLKCSPKPLETRRRCLKDYNYLNQEGKKVQTSSGWQRSTVTDKLFWIFLLLWKYFHDAWWVKALNDWVLACTVSQWSGSASSDIWLIVLRPFASRLTSFLSSERVSSFGEADGTRTVMQCHLHHRAFVMNSGMRQSNHFCFPACRKSQQSSVLL